MSPGFKYLYINRRRNYISCSRISEGTHQGSPHEPEEESTPAAKLVAPAASTADPQKSPDKNTENNCVSASLVGEKSTTSNARVTCRRCSCQQKRSPNGSCHVRGSSQSHPSQNNEARHFLQKGVNSCLEIVVHSAIPSLW